jgi:hypothetical protein
VGGLLFFAIMAFKGKVSAWQRGNQLPANDCLEQQLQTRRLVNEKRACAAPPINTLYVIYYFRFNTWSCVSCSSSNQPSGIFSSVAVDFCFFPDTQQI